MKIISCNCLWCSSACEKSTSFLISLLRYHTDNTYCIYYFIYKDIALITLNMPGQTIKKDKLAENFDVIINMQKIKYITHFFLAILLFGVLGNHDHTHQIQGVNQKITIQAIMPQLGKRALVLPNVAGGSVRGEPPFPPAVFLGGWAS